MNKWTVFVNGNCDAVSSWCRWRFIYYFAGNWRIERRTMTSKQLALISIELLFVWSGRLTTPANWNQVALVCFGMQINILVSRRYRDHKYLLNIFDLFCVPCDHQTHCTERDSESTHKQWTHIRAVRISSTAALGRILIQIDWKRNWRRMMCASISYNSYDTRHCIHP